MAIDLSDLFDKAYLTEEVRNASETIGRALDRFEAEHHVGARAFEVTVPPEPDDTWLRDSLARPLIYFCESEARPVPGCAGVLVMFFVGARLHAVPAEEVIRWLADVLHTPPEQLRDQYGTHEADTALR